MALVTVKPKFQVTIPAKLRRQTDLREGDLLEVALTKDGILLRPKAIVDRALAADRIESSFKQATPNSRDAGRTEEEIIEDVDKEVAKARAARRGNK